MAKTKPQKYVFTNSVGDQFTMLPLNPLEQEVIREQIESEWKDAGRSLPEAPVYEATNAAGETVKIKLSGEKDADTPELKAAWQEYVQASKEFNNQFSESFLISCFLNIDANPDDYSAWSKRMKFKKISIPEDEIEKLILFCKTWVIRTTEDIAGLITAATRTIANVSEEAMQAAEAKFRDRMAEALAEASAKIPEA